MARRTKTTVAPDDPRTVEVTHPTEGTHMVTPEVANALEMQKKGWVRAGGPPGEIDAAIEAATAPLRERIAELEAQLAAAQGDDTTTPPDEGNDQAGPGQED